MQNNRAESTACTKEGRKNFGAIATNMNYEKKEQFHYNISFLQASTRGSSI